MLLTGHLLYNRGMVDLIALYRGFREAAPPGHHRLMVNEWGGLIDDNGNRELAVGLRWESYAGDDGTWRSYNKVVPVDVLEKSRVPAAEWGRRFGAEVSAALAAATSSA
jgi:hypothetical protein